MLLEVLDLAKLKTKPASAMPLNAEFTDISFIFIKSSNVLSKSKITNFNITIMIKRRKKYGNKTFYIS